MPPDGHLKKRSHMNSCFRQRGHISGQKALQWSLKALRSNEWPFNSSLNCIKTQQYTIFVPGFKFCEFRISLKTFGQTLDS